jgi:hypothetical protein
MSVGETQHAVILNNRAIGKYAVVYIGLYTTNHLRYAILGYALAVDLFPDQLQTITGSVQLDLLEEDVYAVSEENL